MKRLIYSMLVLATTAMTLASCEDVPSPYDNPNDNNGNGLPTGTYLNETFNSSLGDFTVVTSKGNPWTNSYSTATATGYNSTDKTNTESESYLVSPEVDLTQADSVYLQFEYIFRYSLRDGEDKVLITRNYTGDPATTTWDDITGTLTEGIDWVTFSTYARQINEYAGGKIRIAFYYSATATNSRTWEVKNVLIKAGKAPEISDNPDGPSTSTGSGTQADPYNVAAAHDLIATLAADVNSDDVYVKGKIVSVGEVSTSFGNATYYISDDGTTTNQLEIYRGYYLGNAKFTAEDQIKAGDEVIVYGKLVNFYGNTHEMTQGNYIYALNGSTADGGHDTGDENTLTVNVSSLGLGNAATLGSTLTLSDGTTLSFAQNEGTTAPKSYTGTTSTIRLYAKNAMTITSSSKAITKVVLTCVSNYLGNESLYGQADNTNVTLEKGDNTLTFSGFSSQALTVVNDHTATSGGTQLRITAIALTYAQ